jgi:hypothetical protein
MRRLLSLSLLLALFVIVLALPVTGILLEDHCDGAAVIAFDDRARGGIEQDLPDLAHDALHGVAGAGLSRRRHGEQQGEDERNQMSHGFPSNKTSLPRLLVICPPS